MTLNRGDLELLDSPRGLAPRATSCALSVPAPGRHGRRRLRVVTCHSERAKDERYGGDPGSHMCAVKQSLCAVQAVCANALVLGNVARDLDVMLWGRGVFVWVCCPGAVWERSRNSSECQFLEIEFRGITTAFPSVPPSVCAPCDF